MADLTITAANVTAASGSAIVQGTAGETITAGQVVYLDATTREYLKADCTDADKYKAAGVALNGASDGQPIDICTRSTDLDLGATLTIGTVYVLSTAGGISPAADLTTNDYAVIVGVANAADSLRCSISQYTRADTVIA